LGQAPVPGSLSVGIYSDASLSEGFISDQDANTMFLVDPQFFSPKSASQYYQTGSFDISYDLEYGTVPGYYRFDYDGFQRTLTYDQGYYTGSAYCDVSFEINSYETGFVDGYRGMAFSAHDYFAFYRRSDQAPDHSELYLRFDRQSIYQKAFDLPISYVYFEYYEVNELGQLISGVHSVKLELEYFIDGELEYYDIDVGQYLMSEGVLSASRPYAYISKFVVALPYRADVFPGWEEMYPGIDFFVRYNYDPSLSVNMFAVDETLPFYDYTAFLATAASGFLNLQIFPGFTISGLLISVIGFACAIWFLKIFAGG
jgi:hypothetical protein